MNENIDLTKILKNCPIGWKFYSSVYGVVEFLGISHGNPVPLHERDDERIWPDFERQRYPIRIKSGFVEYDVSRKGRLKYGVGECTLFPSKDQRDWNKFSAPWYKKERFDPKTLKAFDRVMVRDDHNEAWFCTIFSHLQSEDCGYPYNTASGIYFCCIPYNDETKHLVGTTDEAPEYYRYWED